MQALQDVISGCLGDSGADLEVTAGGPDGGLTVSHRKRRYQITVTEISAPQSLWNPSLIAEAWNRPVAFAKRAPVADALAGAPPSES